MESRDWSSDVCSSDLITTKPLPARIADKNFPSPPASKSSTLKKASPTNPSAASPAVMHAKATPVAATAVALVRCLTLCVLSAEPTVRFLSSPAMTVPFTAATVSEDNCRIKCVSNETHFYFAQKGKCSLLFFANRVADA